MNVVVCVIAYHAIVLRGGTGVACYSVYVNCVCIYKKTNKYVCT